METLSAEHRLVLELYKKERPDIFARLPLPKKLAEEYGVPIKTDTVHLIDFMKSHLAIAHGHYDEIETKVACKVMDASGNEIFGNPEPTDFVEKIMAEHESGRIKREQVQNNKQARNEYFKLQSESKPALNIIDGLTNAAFIPQNPTAPEASVEDS